MTITRTELVRPVAAFEPLTREGQTRRDDPALDGLSAAVKESEQRRAEKQRTAEDEAKDAAGASTQRTTVKLPDFPLRELAFRLDPDTHRVVIQVIDSETKSILRQYPPDESIQVLKQMRESRGLLLDEKG